MKVLVTGASGFVGGYVVRELLRRGHVVTGLVRREQSVHALATAGMHVAVGDISVADSLRGPVRGQDVLIHLAAVVGKDPGGWENHLAQGVRGTENVAQAAAAAGIGSFVHLSSCVVYKAPVGSSPVTEDSPVEDRIEPWNHYLRQKLLCEDVVGRYRDKLAIAMIRPPTVIGPGDPGLIPLLSAIRRSPLGALAKDGGRHFPVVVAEDLAGGIAAAAERAGSARGVYNLASRQPVTKADLLAAFESAGASLGADSAGRAWAISAAARSLDVLEIVLGASGAVPRRMLVQRLEDHARRRAQPDLVVDISRARRELGFEGAGDLQGAIRRVVAWRLASSTPHSA